MGGIVAPVDEAERLAYERACDESLARLDTDPELLAEYRAEAQALAEVDVFVVDDY